MPTPPAASHAAQQEGSPIEEQATAPREVGFMTSAVDNVGSLRAQRRPTGHPLPPHASLTPTYSSSNPSSFRQLAVFLFAFLVSYGVLLTLFFNYMVRDFFIGLLAGSPLWSQHINK